MKQKWHKKTVNSVLNELGTTHEGLSQEQAKERFKRHGANELPEPKRDSPALIFLRQFQSPLIYILLLAAFLVFWTGERADAAIIFAVLLFNAAVGTIQEGRAQNTLAALRKVLDTKATVLRSGEEYIILDREVVPGDIVILQEGDRVPADLRILEANNLNIDEAALTGESATVHKYASVVTDRAITIGDQKNMLFRGTTVVGGHGHGVAVATGTDTEIGKISRQIADIKSDSPLKADIAFLSKLILTVVAILSVLIFGLGLLTGQDARQMFATVVSLAVSVIPEGLPIVMTLVLATGVWRMSKRNALVKKLQAVEALGQAQIIAVDKTGTITRNEMTVEKVYLRGKIYAIPGNGYDPRGQIGQRGGDWRLLGRVAALVSNARVFYSEQDRKWLPIGDPTEAAMQVLAEKLGSKKDELEERHRKAGEAPFDYRNKYHIVVHKVEDEFFMSVAGAPESVFKLCGQKERRALEQAYRRFSESGLRVLALAYRKAKTARIDKHPKGFKFLALLGIKDALRAEVRQSLAQAHSAGLRVVMITGDNAVTAEAIAREAGIYRNGGILTGDQIEEMPLRDLAREVLKTEVFARVTPEHKLRIIQAYKKSGLIVAMTGDGVNDAPSLVAADLGVAMGVIGTEVAKEASDIILLDDNFGSIVAAIEEGRAIYKTIKKVILYLFSTSLGEVLTIAGALVLSWPLPILPPQIIWLNFVTDGFLDVALAMEPKEQGLLKPGFAKQKRYLVDGQMGRRMISMALPMAIGALVIFANFKNVNHIKAWTITLTVLAVFQWFNAWNCRSETQSIFNRNIFSNIYLMAATLIVIVLQMLAVYHPVLQKILHTTALSLQEWLLAVTVAASIILVEELRKSFARNLTKTSTGL